MKLTYNIYDLFLSAYSAYLEGISETNIDQNMSKVEDMFDPQIINFIINDQNIIFTLEENNED